MEEVTQEGEEVRGGQAAALAAAATLAAGGTQKAARGEWGEGRSTPHDHVLKDLQGSIHNKGGNNNTHSEQRASQHGHSVQAMAVIYTHTWVTK
jgi:hypothetical protein